MRVTAERVRELLNYDPETGIFTWRVDRRGGKNNAFLYHKKGDIAGGMGSFGYWVIGIETYRIAAHRLAWLYMTGELPTKKFDIDHINGSRADNRWVNIRYVTRSQNMQNLKTHHKDNETGFLGVEKKRDKFSARICINGQRLSLGSFFTPELAHEAYLKAKRNIHEMGTL